MTFLTITDSKELNELFGNEIKALDKTIKLHDSDFSSKKIIKIKKYIDDASLAIVWSESKQNNDKIKLYLASLFGLMEANNLTIITNLSEITDNSVLDKKSVNIFDTKEQVIFYIKSSYNDIFNSSRKWFARKKLFDKGIPYTADCFGIYIAKDKSEICDLFLASDFDINAKDDLGTPLLNIAVRNDNIRYVKKFVEKGANINAVSEDRGYTAVMDAVWRKNEEITEYLIKKGADLNTINKEGQTNLVLAVGSESEKICKLLAENGADPDIKDQMGMSAFGYASLFHKEKLISILKPYHKE
ncbi:MAG: ankyrin repeat domain-containing protein [Treponema sp.]|nr:ankyrin repeat domain-containing protein [Treponema sp.]